MTEPIATSGCLMRQITSHEAFYFHTDAWWLGAGPQCTSASRLKPAGLIDPPCEQAPRLKVGGDDPRSLLAKAGPKWQPALGAMIRDQPTCGLPKRRGAE